WPHICPCANTRLGTKVPADMYQGVGACTNLLHNLAQWQAVSARGGLVLLGSACVSKGKEWETWMQEATDVSTPSVRPVSRTRRSDPDRSSVTARAITAPARAGPEVVPRAGRATLHGRRAALRAGRPRLGPCGRFL